MNLLKLSWSYLQKKRLNTFLNTLLLAFGVGIIIFLLLVLHQAEEKLRNNAQGIDYVIGAKGSPLQLILNAIYHLDSPTGNIPLSEANAIARNKRLVKRAIPLALGDSYRAYRIVGTTHEYVDFYQCKIAEGKLWQKNFEVTIGATIAQQLGLKVGSKFYSAHGLEDDEDLAHKDHPFIVSGILARSGTVADRLILTNIESIWEVHGQHDHDQEEHGEHKGHHEAHKTDSTHTQNHNPFAQKKEQGEHKGHHEAHKTDSTHTQNHKPFVQKKEKEITAMLIQRRSNMAIVMIPAIANRSNKIQAVSPAREYLNLLENIGIGADVLQYFAYIIIGIAGLSIFIALYNALKEREYDLAIMRTLGATRLKLFTHIILEGVLLASVGAALGLLLGHGAVEFTGQMISNSSQMSITGWQWLTAELGVIALVLGVALFAALIPAIQIYRIDISKTLSR
ncbi:ABC transporter permease [uncultured Microscilla sp.]|uniref:FtsX-like permease family protein n=1 Tax=uncultured Microscilla sp. TaxID=432653 RepID=UPI002608A5A7|nr:ABC transporter permease [uncultured Microscilla sp.]